MDWLIQDEELHQIQNAKVGSYFICPQSWSSTQICIELIIYPNGFCQNEAGNLNIYISTETPLKHSDELQIQYSLQCSAADTRWTGIATFTSTNTNHRLSNKIRTESIMECSRINISCSLEILSSNVCQSPIRSSVASTFSTNQKDIPLTPQRRRPPPSIPDFAVPLAPNTVETEVSKYRTFHGDTVDTINPCMVWNLNSQDIRRFQHIGNGNCIKSPDAVVHDLEWRIRSNINQHALQINISTIPSDICIFNFVL